LLFPSIALAKTGTMTVPPPDVAVAVCTST